MGKKPNILFLLNDHQAYYGHEDPAPKRPNFDRLAEGGVEYRRATCATPLCGPARRTILSGLFPHNHKNCFNYSNQPFLEECYLDRLTEAGYRNYYFGKWHAGPGTALDHGCEGFSLPDYGNPYISEVYRNYLAERSLPQAEHWVDGYLWADHSKRQFPNLAEGGPYRCDSFWCGENAYGRTITPKETHESFFLADLACRQLEDFARNPDGRPFSIRVDFWGPHQPHFPTQEFLDLYNPEEIAEYPSFGRKPEDRPAYYHHVLKPLGGEDMELIAPNPWPWSRWRSILHRCYAHISMIDAAGGRILDTLERLGLAQDTLVIWTTDHGDAIASHGGLWDKGSYLSEEVMRVPLAIRFPNRLPAGLRCDDLVSDLDLAPTILDAAGLRFQNPVDGESLLPRAGGLAGIWREDLMAETAGHGWGNVVDSRLVYAGRYKYIMNVGHVHELYDLEADPYELRNLIDDASCRDVLKDMKKRLEHWRSSSRDTLEAPC
jgi:arylsulfatase A-like enzyme